MLLSPTSSSGVLRIRNDQSRVLTMEESRERCRGKRYANLEFDGFGYSR
jgi:hypothetical protein